jgi:hypothetical protein
MTHDPTQFDRELLTARKESESPMFGGQRHRARRPRCRDVWVQGVGCATALTNFSS